MSQKGSIFISGLICIAIMIAVIGICFWRIADTQPLLPAEYSDYVDGNDVVDDCTVTFLDYNGNVYKTYKVKKGEYFTDVPSISAYGAVFSGWYVQGQGDNIPYISELPILTDVIYESHWVDINIILQNGLGDLNMDVSQLDPQFFEDMAERLRKIQTAQEEENKTEHDDTQ